MKQRIIDYLSSLNYPETLIEQVMKSEFSTFLLSEIYRLFEKVDLSDVEISFIFASENNAKIALSKLNRGLSIDSLVYSRRGA